MLIVESLLPSETSKTRIQSIICIALSIITVQGPTVLMPPHSSPKQAVAIITQYSMNLVPVSALEFLLLWQNIILKKQLAKKWFIFAQNSQLTLCHWGNLWQKLKGMYLEEELKQKPWRNPAYSTFSSWLALSVCLYHLGPPSQEGHCHNDLVVPQWSFI